MTDSNAKDEFHSGRFNDWTECFMVVNTRSLMESFGYESSFKPVNRAIRMSFNTKNPFTTNNVKGRSGWNKFPCPIADQGIIIFGYGLTPMRIFESLGHSCRFSDRGGGKLCVKVKLFLWFVDVVLRAGSHAMGYSRLESLVYRCWVI